MYSVQPLKPAKIIKITMTLKQTSQIPSEFLISFVVAEIVCKCEYKQLSNVRAYAWEKYV